MRKLLFLISLFFLCSNQLYSQEDINNREAKYRSGEHAFKDFLSQTIKYPVYAQEKNKHITNCICLLIRNIKKL